MLRPVVTPSLDPLAHRAAIDALEAQRAAYRRYARLVDAQHTRLNDGDGERAAAFADEAATGFAALETGARQLRPLLDRVREQGSADQVDEVQRRLAELTREARQAETAIHNLAAQLEAWRDAYGRQLAEAGLAPGGERRPGERRGDDGAAGGVGAGAPAAPATGPATGPERTYARPGFGAQSQARRGPSLIDRTG